jgi:hypothetical protein
MEKATYGNMVSHVDLGISRENHGVQYLSPARNYRSDRSAGWKRRVNSK